MQDFTKLLVWQKAIALTVALERVLRRRVTGIPGLRNQMLRAAASISANIAEGCGKSTSAELVRYLLIALGSVNELKSHLALAHGAGMILDEEYECLEAARAEVARMLWSLIQKIKKSSTGSTSSSSSSTG